MEAERLRYIRQQRQVTCVNALTGIPDPAAYVAAFEAMVEALESIGEYWNRDRNDAAMHDACWHSINTAEDALQAARIARGDA